MLLQNLGDDGLGLVAVRGIGNREVQIHAAGILLGVVDDVAVGQTAVGHVHNLVVAGDDLGAGDVDVGYRTRDTLCLDEVVHAEGTGNEQKHSACEGKKKLLHL